MFPTPNRKIDSFRCTPSPPSQSLLGPHSSTLRTLTPAHQASWGQCAVCVSTPSPAQPSPPPAQPFRCPRLESPQAVVSPPPPRGKDWEQRSIPIRSLSVYGIKTLPLYIMRQNFKLQYTIYSQDFKYLDGVVWYNQLCYLETNITPPHPLLISSLNFLRAFVMKS